MQILFEKTHPLIFQVRIAQRFVQKLQVPAENYTQNSLLNEDAAAVLGWAFYLISVIGLES